LSKRGGTFGICCRDGYSGLALLEGDYLGCSRRAGIWRYSVLKGGGVGWPVCAGAKQIRFEGFGFGPVLRSTFFAI
jgi:hypothetical protein